MSARWFRRRSGLIDEKGQKKAYNYSFIDLVYLIFPYTFNPWTQSERDLAIKYCTDPNVELGSNDLEKYQCFVDFSAKRISYSHFKAGQRMGGWGIVPWQGTAFEMAERANDYCVSVINPSEWKDLP